MSTRIFNPIGESELIITPQGTIYHLDVPPGEIADTIITVGDPDRVKEVSKYFDKVTFTAQHREFVTHTGYVGNKRVSVVSTGIGPDNVDIVLNELDALVNIDFSSRTVKGNKTVLSIIRLGTCGALQPDIAVDSMVVSSHGIGLDNLLHYYHHSNTPDEMFILNEFQRHTNMGMKHVVPYITEASISLRKHFSTGFTHGITVTCPGFYGPQGRVLRLPLALPHLTDALSTFSCQDLRVVNFEMETSAIYGLGRLFGHKCLSVSTVVANRTTRTFSKNGDLAVARMLSTAVAIISNID